jgi:chromosome segregation ATPase
VIRNSAPTDDLLLMKDQVADLVVQRLQAQLSALDMGSSADVIAKNVTESVSQLHAPLTDLSASVGSLLQGQQTLQERHESLASSNDGVQTAVGALREKLFEALEVVQLAKQDSPDRSGSAALDGRIDGVESSITALNTVQNSWVEECRKLVSLHTDVQRSMNELPDALVAATDVMQKAHNDFLASRDTLEEERHEIRRLQAANNDMQLQLNKARSAHGQVRVEKDNIEDKLQRAEAERVRLQKALDDGLVSSTIKTEELVLLQQKNSELEKESAVLSANLTSAKSITAERDAKITSLEKVNGSLNSEVSTLKATVCTSILCSGSLPD